QISACTPRRKSILLSLFGKFRRRSLVMTTGLSCCQVWIKYQERILCLLSVIWPGDMTPHIVSVLVSHIHGRRLLVERGVLDGHVPFAIQSKRLFIESLCNTYAFLRVCRVVAIT